MNNLFPNRITPACRLASSLIVSALWLVSTAQARLVPFDFDTGSPTLTLPRNVPFDQKSVGVTAHFSSASGVISLQNSNTTFLILQLLPGNYLMADAPSDVLDIRFSEQFTNISFAFALLEATPVEPPSVITLTAYLDSVANPPVGTTNVSGQYLPLLGGQPSQTEGKPSGTLMFNSVGNPFNLVRLTLPTGTQANGFLVDSITAEMTNHPPVPTNLGLGAVQNQTVFFAEGKLATDRDGDALTFTVNPFSGNGGTLSQVSGLVVYSPPTDFVGSDTFGYSVDDGWGGVANGTVTVTVSTGLGASPNVVFGPLLSNGKFVVRFAGVPSFTYTIESCTDLLSWAKQVNMTAPASDLGLGIGVFEFSMSPAAAETQRYFRTVYPAY
jgi:hypothetical protein